MAHITIDGTLAEVDELIIELMNEQPLAGLAVGVVQGDELVYASGFGLADIEEHKPVTPDTIFRIGSISKTFTAIALMQLWEQSRFQLDDPVNDYLKAYRIHPATPDAPQVTFRHLLTHTAGIGELRSPTDLFRPVIGLGVPAGQPIPSLHDYYAHGLRSEVAPGTKWAYANHAFATVGQLIEDISGEPFNDYMHQHVFAPLGMQGSDYVRSEHVREHLAVGYNWKRGTFKPVKDMQIVVGAAGSIFSSVHDMARYVRALLHDGQGEHGAIIQPQTLRMMLQPHFQLDEHLPAMGLAFWLDTWDGHRSAGHDGGWPGFISSMLFAPDDGLGVLVFTNTTALAPGKIAALLLRRLLDLPNPADKLRRSNVPQTPYLWHELAGSYGPSKGLNTNARIWMGFGGEVEVFVKGKHLMLRSLVGPLWKGIKLHPIDADDPLALAGIFNGQPLRVVFKRNAAGQVDRLCFGFSELIKRPVTQSLRRRGLAGLGSAVGLAALGIGRRKLKRKA
jgi:CubicO group peptidase (beta-lactamase class C family)